MTPEDLEASAPVHSSQDYLQSPAPSASSSTSRSLSPSKLFRGKSPKLFRKLVSIPCIHPLMYPSAYPSTHPSIYSPTHLSTHPFTHPLTYALIHLPTHSLIHPPTHPLIHPPTHSLIHLLTHSSTYLLTHLPFSLSSPSLSLSMHSTVSQTRPWTGVQPPLLLNTFDHSNIPLLQT